MASVSQDVCSSRGMNTIVAIGEVPHQTRRTRTVVVRRTCEYVSDLSESRVMGHESLQHETRSFLLASEPGTGTAGLDTLDRGQTFEVRIAHLH